MRFYELVGDVHRTAEGSLQNPSTGRASQTVVVGAIVAFVTAHVSSASGQCAGTVKSRGQTVFASGRDGGQAYELGLRRDAPAPDAAAPGDVGHYEACPSVASPASGSGIASSAGGACPSDCGERSATLSLSIEESAWWDSRPQ
jgi:hypothetical protein